MNNPIYAVAALRRENKKLKSRLTSYMTDAETWNAQWVAEHKSNERLKRENAKLKAQIEALKDYAHALKLCKDKAYLCEYCTFNGIDFEHEDINCTIDFDGLRKKAEIEVGNDH